MLCFCGQPCQTYEAKKTGETYLKCGVQLNYEAIRKKMQKYKNKRDREGKLARMKLGCNLNLKKSCYDKLHPRLFEKDFRQFPKCHHDLYVRTGLSQSERNTNRTFFTCSATYPNLDCGYFEWFDGAMPEAQETDSDSSSSEGEPIRTAVMKKKKNRKRKRVPLEIASCGDESDTSEDAGPSVKKRGFVAQMQVPDGDKLQCEGCEKDWPSQRDHECCLKSPYTPPKQSLYNPETHEWQSI